jgi:hypothetical protein
MGSRTGAYALILTCMTFSGAALADTWIVFSKDEVAVIQGYYAQHPVQVVQGGQKGKGLPPGIAKNLARGKPLPPGIAKQQLPHELVVALPPVHAGYERVYVDGRVLLVELATQVIHDVLMEAATH